ncbi:MAG: hypothetical protein ACAI43_11285 [Phycisphaerae bacterium]|nr:hypothetical protein [Tepidisphaeraceae bacterium]
MPKRGHTTRSSGAGAIALFALVLTGCNAVKTNTGVATAPQTDVPTAPRAGTQAPPEGVRLKSSISPINYLVGPGGALTIYDATDMKTVVTTTAPTQAIVTIDDDKGISVANVVVKAGPLPRGHRYELYLKK